MRVCVCVGEADGNNAVTLERWASEGDGAEAQNQQGMETDLVDLMMEDNNRLGSPLYAHACVKPCLLLFVPV